MEDNNIGQAWYVETTDLSFKEKRRWLT